MRYLPLALLSILVGCAKPNYASPDSAPANNQRSARNGCTFVLEKSGLCATVYWEQLSAGRVCKFHLVLSDLHSQLVRNPDGDIAVTPWMPSHGHGTMPVKIEHPSQGVYNISNVIFNMLGTWEVRFKIISRGQVYDEAAMTYTF